MRPGQELQLWLAVAQLACALAWIGFALADRHQEPAARRFVRWPRQALILDVVLALLALGQIMLVLR